MQLLLISQLGLNQYSKPVLLVRILLHTYIQLITLLAYSSVVLTQSIDAIASILYSPSPSWD